MTTFFKVDRSIFFHDIFEETPYSKREAFMWLISKATYKPKTVCRKGRKINLLKGQLCESMRSLAKHWGWTLSKVQRFIEKLKTTKVTDTVNDTLIDTQTDTDFLIITVCNLGENSEKKFDTDTVTDTQTDTQTDTIYKEEQRRTKKEKQEKEKSFFVDTSTSLFDFQKLADVYPRMTNRTRAMRTFEQKLMQGVKPDDIIAGFTRWQKAHREAYSDDALYAKFAPELHNWLRDDLFLMPEEQEKNEDPIYGFGSLEGLNAEQIEELMLDRKRRIDAYEQEMQRVI